jgi:hypothetical protein
MLLARRAAKNGTYQTDGKVLGFVGYQVGSDTFYGDTASHTMLRISGEAANHAFNEINWLGDHYSRLDIQVTVWLPELPITYKERLYHILCRQYDPITEKGNVPRETGDAKGGWTIYSSARTNKVMARIYSKWHETPQPHYKGAIRYELELKDLYATQMAQVLHSHNAQAERYILSYIYSWFRKKGINLPYKPYSSAISTLSVPHVKSTIETQLQWLERQVKPTVRRLSDVGLREYVIMLLFGSEETELPPTAEHKPEEL